MKLIPLLFVLSFTISACGGGSEGLAPVSSPKSNPTWPGSDENVVPDSYGYLLDSAVKGLRYKSGGHYGVTSSSGRFGYISGENIEFYIGNSLIAYADIPTELVTPYELSSSGPFSTVDILRLLQSLDDDGDLSNGIKIIEAVHKLAESVTLEPNSDLSVQVDAIDPAVITALTNVTSGGSRSVVSGYDAYYHFASTLDSLIDNKESDIQSLANQTTCTTSEQCDSIELDTKYTFYCPPRGSTIAYSVNDIDELQLDTLVAEREYFIGAKGHVKVLAGASINVTGVCLRNDPPEFLICNTSNRCEIKTLN